MKPVQPESKATNQNESFTVSALMARFVEKQSQAHQDGMAAASREGEVLPYDAGPVQMVEPQLAWTDSMTALGTAAKPKPCPEWPALVAAQEPAYAVAFCIGNFPQMVRNFLPMLQSETLNPEPVALGTSLDTSVYLAWAERTAAQGMEEALVAAAVLRLAQETEQATAILDAQADAVPEGMKSVWMNERAAVLWHAGNQDAAVQIWESMERTTAVQFNLGMTALFQGRNADAKSSLTEAVKEIPSDTAWHHLAQLYLTMAAMRAAS